MEHQIHSNCLPAWEVAELPEPKPLKWEHWTRFIGPGIVMMGIQIGGGEWLLGPDITAKYGGGLMWIATIAIICQVFYNLECGRYALYCGEPIFTGFMRTKPGPRFWMGLILFLNLSSLIPGLSTHGAAMAASLYLDRPPGVEDRWLVTTPRFNAREITVSGLGRTTRDEVLRAAGLAGERNVLSVDCVRTARDIEGLPWVSRARVTRRLPGSVTITVEERSAVATVSAGSMYLVGSDGTLFKRVSPGDPADLPVVTGIDRAAFEQDAPGAREEVRDALALLGDVEASAVGATLRIDEVHREPTGDLSIVAEGAHVWLGRGPYRAKLTRLRVVLRELERRGLRASEIHLETDRHPERVTVRVATRAPTTPG